MTGKLETGFVWLTFQFVIDACRSATDHHFSKLPIHEWLKNSDGKPDCGIYVFSTLSSSKNSCKLKVKHGHKLLVTVIGDAMMEPYWPEGSGLGRGFLSSMDSAWMFRQFCM